MTIRGLWQVTGGDTVGAVRELLGKLLESQVVDALLVPVEGADHAVMPALVKNATRLNRADPFAPVMAFNSARLVSQLTHGGAGARIGAVLRSCEIRAVIELAKFNQVNLDDTVIIGMDCLGTLKVPEYARAVAELPDLERRFLSQAARGDSTGLAFRTACLMCEHPEPENADLRIGFIGVQNDKALVVEMRDEIAARLGLVPTAAEPEGRAAVLAALAAARAAEGQAQVARWHDAVHAGGMARYFSQCLECTNCMTACPICYCKECFFRTANAEHAPRELLRLAERQGALAMMPDALLFQMTRLNHMATSCVACGMCEAACPHNIPLTAMFRAVGARVQKIFDYEPGRDRLQKPPFMEFKRDELPEIGE